MVAYPYRMDVGFMGGPNRAHDSTIEVQQIDPSAPPTAFGVGVVIDATTGGIRLPASGDTAIYGLYVRPFPTVGGPVSNDPLYTSTPPTQGQGNVMKRGYMTVQLNGAVAATKDAPVYVWKAAAGSGQVPGGITADGSVPADVIQLPSSYFTGPADAKNMTEIAYNI
jgi:hypothetical protein